MAAVKKTLNWVSGLDSEVAKATAQSLNKRVSKVILLHAFGVLAGLGLRV